MTTKAQVIQDIANHVRDGGGSYSQWYCGIAADAPKRLFNDHNVSKEGGSWIYRTCDNSGDARAVEDYFHEKGMRGGPGGGDSTTKMVYAYKINNTTKE